MGLIELSYLINRLILYVYLLGTIVSDTYSYDFSLKMPVIYLLDISINDMHRAFLNSSMSVIPCNISIVVNSFLSQKIDIFSFRS